MAFFKFKPILKSLLWGGDKIIEYKGIESTQTNVGESWELSGVAGDESIIAEGKYEGVTLSGLIKEFKGELLGTSNYERFGEEFPMLIKFIDAQQALSIQVHPDDELSQKRHNKKGKTEMWYVVGADQGSSLRVGFSQRITPFEYEEHIKNDTITEVLKEYPIENGDLFFLPAGRIHSIGSGALIAEIQQTSDVTYRIYDFNRTDAEGNTRELHTELSKDAINYEILPDYRTHYTKAKNSEIELASCDYFTTMMYDLDQEFTCNYSSLDSFVVVICLEGGGILLSDDGRITTLRQGETTLLPATTKSLTVKPKNTIKILTSYI